MSMNWYSETPYHYLQSRYYDPGICRFINADDEWPLATKSNDAKLKPEQIKKQMRNRFKQIKVSKAVFDYIANVLAGAAKKKKYSWS